MSARALARLRADRGGGWVPSRAALGVGEEPGPLVGAGPPGRGVPDGDADAGAGADADADADAAAVPVPRRRGRVRGWVRAPTALVGARWQPGRPAVGGVVLVTVLAVLVLGLRVAWASGADGDPVAPGPPPGPTGVSAAAGPVGVPVAAVPGPTGAGVRADGGAAGGGAAVEVVVHVVGEVRRPGVRHLPAGSRVADAVEAAGGATARADLAGVNLARVLTDGEQLRVPRPGEAVPAPVAAPATGVPGAGGGAAVALSTADVAALDALPGIGPVLAQRIVDWRTEHGRFTTVDELAEVSGIGEKLLAQVRPHVTP